MSGGEETPSSARAEHAACPWRSARRPRRRARLNPQCADCKWPERAAREEAEAVEFVVLLGDSAEELAAPSLRCA